MKGKTIVITGGTSGIGEVAAEALAQIGARIILVARSKSRAEATLAIEMGGRGTAIVLNECRWYPVTAIAYRP